MRLVVSVGCPCGVGPEVSVVAAAAERASRVLLVGDVGAIRGGGRGRGIDAKSVVRVAEPGEGLEGEARAGGHPGLAARARSWRPATGSPARRREPRGAAQLAWIDAACDLVANGGGDALVTGPVSKEAIVRSGAPGSAEFLGHTEHLQRRLRAREVVMAFWSPDLVTALATTHVPLAEVPRAVTPSRASRGRRTGSRGSSRERARTRRASPSRRSTRTPARAACSGARRKRASFRASRPRGGAFTPTGSTRRSTGRFRPKPPFGSRSATRAVRGPAAAALGNEEGGPASQVQTAAGAASSPSITTRRPSR